MIITGDYYTVLAILLSYWISPARVYNIQPFASYRLAFRRKQVLKSYNCIVCPLKLFVLILTWEKHIAKICKKASTGIGAIT
jgi:hypothetical protein